MEDWNWKPRYDLDLTQRCVAIIGFSWLFSIVAYPLLSVIGFQCLLRAPLDFVTILFILAAIMRSSIQYSPKGKPVLVTGCDSGFGFKLAQELHKLGFQVFAGCLFSGKDGAKQLADIGIEVIQLDVTKEVEWSNAVEHIREKTGKLWGLVHNAGWSTFGEIEWVHMDTYRRIAEINTFGIILGTQKVLPLIRPNKGRIVTITSGLVRGATPSRSPYVFTKYAIVGFIECLRYEMKRFGVEVSMIEPGNFLAGTKLFDSSIIDQTAQEMWCKMPDEVKRAYGEDFFKSRVELMRSYNGSGLRDLSPVIESYINGLLDVFPQVRYQPMTLSFKVRSFVATHLPEWFFEWYYT